MCSWGVSLLRSFCRLPCVRRAGKRRCEGGSSGPSLLQLPVLPASPRLGFSPSSTPFLTLRRSTFPGALWGKLPWSPAAPAREQRGADRLSSFCLCGFCLGAPAGRTAPLGQPRRAWMSRRSESRRWSCCCFASPCGYCNTIQLRQTPSFISVSIRLNQERKTAETRSEIDYCGMPCWPAAALSISGFWRGGVTNHTV